MPNPLFVDAVILVRCVVGRAAIDTQALLKRGVVLATTDAQAREAERVLHFNFDISAADAAREMAAVITPMTIYRTPSYRSQETAARARIHYKNTGDWPLLAAAISHGGAIWTDDRDFFGTGVPTWTTRNIRHMPAA